MTKTKNCFVIAPIGEDGSETRRRSDQVLKHIIRPATKECGYSAERADEIDKPGLITSQVIQRVIDDPLVVADLTETNPNVFYELAVRHALRKPLVQIIEKGQRIPFDVAATRTIHVDHTDLDSADKAREEIVSQIKRLEKETEPMETPISVSLELQNLRQSDDPQDRKFGEVLSELNEMRVLLSKQLSLSENGTNREIIHRLSKLDQRMTSGRYESRGEWSGHDPDEVMRTADAIASRKGRGNLIDYAIYASQVRHAVPWVADAANAVVNAMVEQKQAAIEKAINRFMSLVALTVREERMRVSMNSGPEIMESLYMIHQRNSERYE